MEYTDFMYAGIGFAGILAHNLRNLNAINRRNKGSVNIAQYWAMERFTIMFSVLIILVVSFMLNNEYKYSLKYFGAEKIAGISMFCFGYMAQSIVIGLMGRVEKHVKEKAEKLVKDEPNESV